MTMLPYEPPKIDHLDQFIEIWLNLSDDLLNCTNVESEKREVCNKAYGKIQKTYSNDIACQSEDHCVYCGVKLPSPDLDHWYPKGRRDEFYLAEEELLEHYRMLAGLSAIDKDFKFDLKRFMLKAEKKSPENEKLTLCIAPGNLMPSCPFCNQRRAVRMPDDSRDTRGKGSLYPVKKNGDQEPTPLFLHPANKNWNLLINLVNFFDIQDDVLIGPYRSLGSTAFTLVTPAIEQLKNNEPDALRTAATIEILGLNRKSLAEDRFRLRQNFRFFISRLEKETLKNKSIIKYINSTEVKKNDINPSLYVLAVNIRSYILSSPLKLALLDELRTWLKKDEFNKLDVDRFMSTPNNETM